MEKLGVIKKLRPIFLGVLLCFIIYMAIINTKADNRRVTTLKKEYQNVDNQDSFSGIVIDYLINRGAVLITLNNNYKTCINSSRNYTYDTQLFYKFISVGDSIVKKAYSDTLHIYRNNQKYYFVIGEFIGDDSVHEK